MSAVTNHMVARTPSRVREQSVVALNQSGMRILESTGERTVSERAKYPLSWGSKELQKGAIIVCTIFQNIAALLGKALSSLPYCLVVQLALAEMSGRGHF